MATYQIETEDGGVYEIETDEPSSPSTAPEPQKPQGFIDKIKDFFMSRNPAAQAASALKPTGVGAVANALPGALGTIAGAAASHAVASPADEINRIGSELPAAGAIAGSVATGGLMAIPAAGAGAALGTFGQQGIRALQGKPAAQPVDVPLYGKLPEVPGVGPVASEAIQQAGLAAGLETGAKAVGLLGKVVQSGGNAILDFAADVRAGTANTAGKVGKIPKFNLEGIKQYGGEIAGAVQDRATQLGTQIDDVMRAYDANDVAGRINSQAVVKKLGELADNFAAKPHSSDAQKFLEDGINKLQTRLVGLTEQGTKGKIGALDLRNFIKEVDTLADFDAAAGPGQKEAAKVFNPLRTWARQQLSVNYPHLSKAISDYSQLIKDSDFLDVATKVEGTGEITDEVVSKIDKALPRFLKTDKVLSEQLDAIFKRLGHPGLSKTGTALAVSQQLAKPTTEAMQGFTGVMRGITRPVGRAVLPAGSVVTNALGQVEQPVNALSQIAARKKLEIQKKKKAK